MVFIFLISAMVLIIGVIGTLRSWNWLQIFTPISIPIYNIFKGVFLGLACLTAAMVLWLRYPWSIFYCSTVAIVTAAWFWVDRIALTHNPLPFSRHIIPLVVTFLVLIFVQMSLTVLTSSVHPQPQITNLNHPPNLPTGGQHDQTTS